MQIDVSRAQDENVRLPKVKYYERRRFLDTAGMRLATITLAIILIYIIFLSVYFYNSDINAGMIILKNKEFIQSGDEKIIQLISEQTSQTRAFILDISKSILLNLLLPILTATLGYIFGSREAT